MIASALVGTFLGILLAYAVVEPLGACWSKKSEDSLQRTAVHQDTLLASMQGYNPSTAIEFGRKVLSRPIVPPSSNLKAMSVARNNLVQG